MRWITLPLFLFMLVPDVYTQWLPQYSPTSEDLNAVQFVDQEKGWIIGNEVILSTTDGGLNWNVYSIPGIYLLDLFTVNENVVWAVGTTMFGLDPGRAVIMKTIDGGDTWTLIDSTQNGYFGSVFFYDTRFGWITGAEGPFTDSFGMVYRTTDGGDSWQRTEDNTIVSLTDAFFISPADGWMVSIDAYIYLTTDSGYTWTVADRATNNTFNVPLRAITFVTPDTGWAIGGLSGNSVVGRTNDGGESWLFDNFFTGSTFRNCFFIDSKRGWIVGGLNVSPKVYMTDDGGQTLIAQSHGLSQEITTIMEGIWMIDEYAGWIVGRNGTILKASDASVTNITHNTESLPPSFVLYQNYPNPFNPSTIIPFSLPESGWVTLKVYDILGREVQTLIEEFRPAGTYNVRFDNTESASGVFLYQLRIHNSVLSKRMILSK
jgi:photosystem II stability/assembly factor-like uncharacterized protein